MTEDLRDKKYPSKPESVKLDEFKQSFINKTENDSKLKLKKDKRATAQLPPLQRKKEKIQRFPGDFENFTKSKEFKKAKAENLSTYKLAREHPVERKDAGYKFLMDAGPKEVKAFKEYRKRTAKTRDEAKTQNMAKGGRVGLRGGGICKKGMNKKAIGKNS